ncbi:hypothetical protein [Stenotrophomonas sp. ATCM1_4]|uniref:hypothetical protein n=1 Tax=Stenotrophomonas sp. ATCM1_4 TaxID=2259330 RepID=UPI001044989A|nr:hypothetical protein [Stenotrophomonas sp. ATCM1_4]
MTVYRAPTAGRRYLSKRAAVRAEARALMERKYPTERGDETDGWHHWHWSEDPRLALVYDRLVRMLSRAMATGAKGAANA